MSASSKRFVIKKYQRAASRAHMSLSRDLLYLLLCLLQDEISRVLLRILQACGKATEFLSSIVMDEVTNLGKFLSLLFVVSLFLCFFVLPRAL